MVFTFQRPRANSEPWMTTSSLHTLFPHSRMNVRDAPSFTSSMKAPPLMNVQSFNYPLNPSQMTNRSSMFSNPGYLNMGSGSGLGSSSSSQPHFMDSVRYQRQLSSHLYGYPMTEHPELKIDDGRIGIYTKEVRSTQPSHNENESLIESDEKFRKGRI